MELREHQIGLEPHNEESHRTMSHLEAARAHYASLYDLAPVGYITVGEPGLILESNLTAATLLGEARETLVGSPASRFIRSEDVDGYNLFCRRLAETGETRTSEVRMVRRDGTSFWAHLVASAAKDAKGVAVYHIALSVSSERKQTEESLRLGVKRYRSILQTAMDGIWIIDMQGKLLEVNDTYCRMSGYSRQELLTLSVSDLEASETIAETAARIQKIKAQGEVRFESRHRCKNGSLFDVEVSAQYHPEDGGCLVTFFQDITEHKRAEAAMRESEQQYRSLFNSMTEGFALHDLLFDNKGHPCDYRFLTVNHAFERLTGIKAESLVGKSQRQVLPDEDPFWFETYSQVALTGEPRHIEHYSPSLQRHFGVFVYRPAPNQFATIFSDITERKQADTYRSMSLCVLHILNEQSDLRDAVQSILSVLKE